MSSREKELTAALRQKEAELKQANGELEERGKLLYKTKVAIEQLQQELISLRDEKDEAHRVCDEQAGHLQQAVEQLQQFERELSKRATESQKLQGRVAELESELESSRHSASSSTAALEGKVKDRDRRVEGLQEVVEHQREQLAALEKLLRERSTALAEARDRAASSASERDSGEATMRDLSSRHSKVLAEKQHAEEEVARLQQQLAAKGAELERTAAELAETRQQAAAAEKAGAAKLRAAQAEAEGKQAELAAELGAKVAAAQRGQMEAEMAMHRRLGEQDQELLRRLQDVEAEWQGRLQAALHECEARHREELRQWEKRLQEADREWHGRLLEADKAAALKLASVQQRLEAEVSELQAALARHPQMEGLRQQHETAMAQLLAKTATERADMERSYSQKAEERERYWRAKLDEVQLRAEEQAAAAEQRWSAGAAEAEARWRGKVDELRHAWGTEQAALEAEWSEKMEQSHTRWLREKEALEAAWSERMASVQDAAARRFDVLQHELELKVGGLTGRLGELAKREARREARRGEVAQQIEELRQQAEEEASRRAHAERALREATAAHTRELQELQQALAGAQGDLRTARAVAFASGPSSSPAAHHSTLSFASPPQAGYGSLPSASGMYGTPGRPASPSMLGLGSPRHYASPSLAGGGGGGGEPLSSALVRTSLNAAELEGELAALRQEREQVRAALLAQDPLPHSLPRRPASASSPSSRLSGRLAGSGRYGLHTSTAPLGSKTAGGLRHGSPRAGAAAAGAVPATTGKIRSRVWEDDVRSSLSDTDTDIAAFDSWRQELSARLGSAMRKLEPALHRAV